MVNSRAALRDQKLAVEVAEDPESPYMQLRCLSGLACVLV